MTNANQPSRRRYLQIAGAGALAATAGCLDLLSGRGGPENVILDPPEQYEMLREARDDGNLAHPIHGDELPSVTVPDVLRERDVSTSEFVGETHSLYTFVFTRCHAACPALVSSLRHVQADSIDEGYEDEVALLTVTFDPEYDTADVLSEYGEDMGVEYDADNWYFLRPETEDDAHGVVQESFGCYFERNPDYEGDDGHHGGDGHEHDEGEGSQAHDDEEGHGHDGGEHDDEHGHEDDEGNGGENNGDGHGGMAFQHESMIVFANADGHVERTYRGAGLPAPGDLVDDVRTVVDGW